MHTHVNVCERVSVFQKTKKKIYTEIFFLSLSLYLSECKNEATNYISTGNQNNGKNESRKIQKLLFFIVFFCFEYLKRT